ncbi:MAG TPA: tRNA (adenosine(37)-N6)-dimethylallyltransferase MiaA [Armatimonadota bacterium]|nr:tRNA (adenosine(37)-N6)-dimethylallyltransferase MiaA [Armatimonadota bacterium]
MHGTLVGIVGPTATGKTAVGVELAKRLDGEIVSADSMAVYKGMDIGTAKPTTEQRAAVRFHLIDVVRPDEEFSVAEFKRFAEGAIADVLSRGKVPLLVGGTGLYVKAVAGGLNIPAVAPDRELRERLRAEAAEFGGERLLERLRAVDSITAERLHPKDLKRIIRALEVHMLTGLPISHFHTTAGTTEAAYHAALFALSMSRSALYSNIEQRVDQQIDAGLVEEVRGLFNEGYSPDLSSMKGLGYKQIAGYLLGDCDLETAIRLLKRDTRRFAKRQLTWFRADPRIRWIDVEGRGAPDVAAELASLLGKRHDSKDNALDNMRGGLVG